MPTINLQTAHHSAPLKSPFRISRGEKTSAETVRVTLSDGRSTGRGEAVPYARYGETIDGVLAEIENIREEIEAGLNRGTLQERLGPGAARCALDCALWDLEAKQSGVPIWTLAGLPEPRPCQTAITVSLDTPDAMADAARNAPGHILKLKLDGEADLDRIEAVRAARPETKLIVDANEGFNTANLVDFARQAAALGVSLIEQPLPATEDGALKRVAAPVAICADESAHTTADVERLVKLYDVVNVKLDKAGGLTEGLRMVREARLAGMGVMVGCMVAGSLSMAPAVLLAQICDVADLDGPLWLTDDEPHGLSYANGVVSPPSTDLWG